jgi:PadR family transcriptional regulator PadR
MGKQPPAELLQGTLDMLILKALSRDVLHGYAIAQWIKDRSGEVLRVEEGSLYPALHRLEVQGLLASGWGHSVNNRRAKYYRLTAAGRRQLAHEQAGWSRVSSAVTRVMEAAS